MRVNVRIAPCTRAMPGKLSLARHAAGASLPGNGFAHARLGGPPVPHTGLLVSVVDRGIWPGNQLLGVAAYTMSPIPRESSVADFLVSWVSLDLTQG